MKYISIPNNKNKQVYTGGKVTVQVTNSVVLRGKSLDTCRVRSIWIFPPLQKCTTGWAGRGRYGAVFYQRKGPRIKDKGTINAA